ncbi:MAG: energy transducer TonB [Cytophagales bacterium]|nr:energy transducer TonB [Cytophagales bacterium]
MFEWRIQENGSEVDLELHPRNFEDLIEVPQTQQIQRPPVQVSIPKIIEVDDEEIIEEIEINLDIEMTEDTRIEEVVFKDLDNGSIPEEKADEIFTIVEEQPSPEGGIKAFYEYVSSNLEYPAKARRIGLEGRVFVEFVVEKDGSLTDVKAIKGIGGGCDEEAVRVISSAPKWNPGKQRGRAVRVRMIMPIMFKILDH